MRTIAAALVFTHLLTAQQVRVVSEFHRVGPDGANRVEHPREILSPAVARNGWATFRIVVEAPAGVPYALHVGQNPEASVAASIYQEEYKRVGEDWAPDGLKPLSFPVGATLGEGQKAQTYLLDLWVPEKTPAGRFRIEVQMHIDGRWILYPMEFRTQELVVREKAVASGVGYERAVRETLCGEKKNEGVAAALNVAAILERNVRQDLSLARPGANTSTALAAGYESVAAFCEAANPSPRGAEWWLKARDFLLQGIAVR